jgi:hypothetical protein
MTGVDNSNENNQIHTGRLSISFNAPVVPKYSPVYPLN